MDGTPGSVVDGRHFISSEIYVSPCTNDKLIQVRT